MELMLEMAENYSEKVLAGKESAGSVGKFDGQFEPLVVPGSIVGALDNVFEQVDGEVGKEGLEGLEGLKKALKPLLEFREEAVRKR